MEHQWLCKCLVLCQTVFWGGFVLFFFCFVFTKNVIILTPAQFNAPTLLKASYLACERILALYKLGQSDLASSHQTQSVSEQKLTNKPG